MESKDQIDEMTSGLNLVSTVVLSVYEAIVESQNITSPTTKLGIIGAISAAHSRAIVKIIESVQSEDRPKDEAEVN